MPTRNATATWSGGGLKTGKGEFHGESGVINGKYNFNTRFGEEPGTNPEVELCTFLNDTGFGHVPPVAGWIEYLPDDGAAAAAIVQGMVPARGDAYCRSCGAPLGAPVVTRQ